ncbi:MAG: hypothetical protein ACUVR4_04175 [Anaerolineae bacterium]
MCQATVYLGEQEIAREVIWLEPITEGVRFATLRSGRVKARLLAAAQLMEEPNAQLSAALAELGGPLEHHPHA